MDKDFLKFMSFVAFMEAKKGSRTGLLCRSCGMAGAHPYRQKKARPCYRSVSSQPHPDARKAGKQNGVRRKGLHGYRHHRSV